MAKINCLLAGVVCAFLAHNVFAAPETSQKELDQIRQEIQAADKDMRNKKAQQDKLAAQIRQTDKELSKQRAELAKIQDEKQVAVAELERLQQDAMALETRIEAMKGQVARLMDSRYRNRRPEAMIMLLQNKDPNEKGRQLEYLRQIQAANRQALTNFAEQKNQLQQQSELIKQQMAKIQSLMDKQRKIIADLEKQKKSNLSAAAKLDNEISANEQKIKGLRQDEQRMVGVLKNIAERNQAAQNESQPVFRQPENNANTAFGKLQGKLPMPMSGKITGRFGDDKPSGGVYNGIYIAGNAGTVRAVAGGTVAYARELRGYGNTVVIDHDGDYLTIYSGLSMFAVTAGETVSAKQQIGVSGALPNDIAGLYFELRYRTKPLNPAAWVKR